MSTTKDFLRHLKKHIQLPRPAEPETFEKGFQMGAQSLKTLFIEEDWVNLQEVLMVMTQGILEAQKKGFIDCLGHYFSIDQVDLQLIAVLSLKQKESFIKWVLILKSNWSNWKTQYAWSDKKIQQLQQCALRTVFENQIPSCFRLGELNLILHQNLATGELSHLPWIGRRLLYLLNHNLIQGDSASFKAGFAVWMECLDKFYPSCQGSIVDCVVRVSAHDRLSIEHHVLAKSPKDYAHVCFNALIETIAQQGILVSEGVDKEKLLEGYTRPDDVNLSEIFHYSLKSFSISQLNHLRNAFDLNLLMLYEKNDPKGFSAQVQQLINFLMTCSSQGHHFDAHFWTQNLMDHGNILTHAHHFWKKCKWVLHHPVLYSSLMRQKSFDHSPSNRKTFALKVIFEDNSKSFQYYLNYWLNSDLKKEDLRGSQWNEILNLALHLAVFLKDEQKIQQILDRASKRHAHNEISPLSVWSQWLKEFAIRDELCDPEVFGFIAQQTEILSKGTSLSTMLNLLEDVRQAVNQGHLLDQWILPKVLSRSRAQCIKQLEQLAVIWSMKYKDKAHDIGSSPYVQPRTTLKKETREECILQKLKKDKVKGFIQHQKKINECVLQYIKKDDMESLDHFLSSVLEDISPAEFQNESSVQTLTAQANCVLPFADTQQEFRATYINVLFLKFFNSIKNQKQLFGFFKDNALKSMDIHYFKKMNTQGTQALENRDPRRFEYVLRSLFQSFHLCILLQEVSLALESFERFIPLMKKGAECRWFESIFNGIDQCINDLDSLMWGLTEKESHWLFWSVLLSRSVCKQHKLFSDLNALSQLYLEVVVKKANFEQWQVIYEVNEQIKLGKNQIQAGQNITPLLSRMRILFILSAQNADKKALTSIVIGLSQWVIMEFNAFKTTGVLHSLEIHCDLKRYLIALLKQNQYRLVTTYITEAIFASKFWTRGFSVDPSSLKPQIMHILDQQNMIEPIRVKDQLARLDQVDGLIISKFDLLNGFWSIIKQKNEQEFYEYYVGILRILDVWSKHTTRARILSPLCELNMGTGKLIHQKLWSWLWEELDHYFSPRHRDYVDFQLKVWLRYSLKVTPVLDIGPIEFKNTLIKIIQECAHEQAPITQLSEWHLEYLNQRIDPIRKIPGASKNSLTSKMENLFRQNNTRYWFNQYFGSSTKRELDLQNFYCFGYWQRWWFTQKEFLKSKHNGLDLKKISLSGQDVSSIIDNISEEISKHSNDKDVTIQDDTISQLKAYDNNKPINFMVKVSGNSILYISLNHQFLMLNQFKKVNSTVRHDGQLFALLNDQGISTVLDSLIKGQKHLIGSYNQILQLIHANLKLQSMMTIQNKFSEHSSWRHFELSFGLFEIFNSVYSTIKNNDTELKAQVRDAFRLCQYYLEVYNRTSKKKVLGEFLSHADMEKDKGIILQAYFKLIHSGIDPELIKMIQQMCSFTKQDYLSGFESSLTQPQKDYVLRKVNDTGFQHAIDHILDALAAHHDQDAKKLLHHFMTQLNLRMSQKRLH